MTDQNNASTPAPSLALAGQIMIAMVVGIGLWIILGGYVLHLRSFFASFLFLWYWASIEKMDFARLPASIIGALVGAALAFQYFYFSVHLGTIGLIIGLLVLAAAVFGLMMGWAPIALNNAAMLFLTAMTAPQIMSSVNFLEVDASIILGAAYFAGSIYLAKRIIEGRAQARPNLA